MNCEKMRSLGKLVLQSQLVRQSVQLVIVQGAICSMYTPSQKWVPRKSIMHDWSKVSTIFASRQEMLKNASCDTNTISVVDTKINSS